MTTVHPDGGEVFTTGPEVTLRCEFGERTLWWGAPWQWATASYWGDQATGFGIEPGGFRLGESVVEELGACILGGFGMPAAVGLAAYEGVRDAGLLRAGVTAPEIERVLRGTFDVNGRAIRYRFPRQRAVRLADAIAYLTSITLPEDPRAIRDVLLGAPGVGPKTASWIVRNQFDCDDVAILDIHICRAGEAAGVFDRGWRISRDYARYEAFFLAWAEHAGVRASILDVCIWAELAELGSADLPTRHA